MCTLGKSLAHGLAHRHGREGIQQLQARARHVSASRVNKPGKQSRQAAFKRLRKDIRGVYGTDCILFAVESGQKKDALSIYYCVEPHEDGGHTVFVVAISARTPQPQVLPLLHFNRHATAGLLQATTTEQPIAALRRLNALFACLAHFDHADDACEHVVLVEPDVGWMPTRFNRNKGVAEVKTVISAAALSPWRKALLLGCATEQRRILVDTRPNSEIRNDIGNNPKTLAFWPTAEYWVATHHGEPPASASR